MEGSTGVGATNTTADVDADAGSSTSNGPSTITASEGSSSDSSRCDDADLGAACVDPVCDCASDTCFEVGLLGGVCSECDESADCEAITGFGCNFGNPLTGTPAVCSKTGDIGESCETVDDCAIGLHCPTLLDVAGILLVATCSECEGDMGCTMGQICAPTYDIATFGGYHSCVAPASVPNGSGCNPTGDGSECMSGQCAPASLMSIPWMAVCSPCNEDADCNGGLTCQLPEVTSDEASMSLMLVPGQCI